MCVYLTFTPISYTASKTSYFKGNLISNIVFVVNYIYETLLQVSQFQIYYCALEYLCEPLNVINVIKYTRACDRYCGTATRRAMTEKMRARWKEKSTGTPGLPITLETVGGTVRVCVLPLSTPSILHRTSSNCMRKLSVFMRYAFH